MIRTPHVVAAVLVLFVSCGPAPDREDDGNSGFDDTFAILRAQLRNMLADATRAREHNDIDKRVRR